MNKLGESYVYPSTDSYTIYTKSGCPNCTKVKKLLCNVTPNPLVIDCDEYIIEDKISFIEFIKKIAKKEYNLFPIVFLNGQFIGGYNETKELYDRERCFFENEDF